MPEATRRTTEEQVGSLYTGRVHFLKYVAVHDCGTLVNPRSLAGHITGGVMQGIGTALYEQFVYDETGNLVTQSYLDYLLECARGCSPPRRRACWS